MEAIKLVARAITQDLNREESNVIEAIGKGTEFLFKFILFLGIPFFLFVLSQFFKLL
ncbi:hypothetical protein [Bacillus sp. B15-48]|uniref:hypothetical protein n=1 Tax=Bacillus sp. B15-48 TaxID=1548601 RepID=UPI00193F5C09|nr:hypothetical protein [Bacillus sp. B15-48]MBM4762006.1 hypothetical protein [Bacillus sp. B15-48]